MKNLAKPVPHLSESATARFWSKVDRSEPTECWPWKAARFARGYGAFRVVVSKNHYRQMHASRIAYFLATGVNPNDLFVCHSCDTPACCNPAHLFLGTARDNERDKMRKGRKPRFAGGRRKLSDEQVVKIRDMWRMGHAQGDIAAMFDCTKSNISRIVTLKSRRLACT